jgi:malate dehydrogenase (oxaloacetate-decarboxylating)
MASIYDDTALEQHKHYKGKLAVVSKVPLETREDLSIYYTPGVAAPCLEIAADEAKAYEYTRKSNSVAVISDGSAVLGLGNIGGIAWLPVMEGKAILMKWFADIDAIPLVLSTQDPDEIIRVVEAVAPTFWAINLEDIAAPACFYIEEELQKRLSIPVFHDDQHGTAIVVLAALLNGLKLTWKKIDQIKIVIAGAGAAGIATANLLVHAWVHHLVMTDSHGVVWTTRSDLNKYKTALLKYNTFCETWTLGDALVWADVFIGVSRPNIVTREMVATMANQAMVFALSNPNPEITLDEAKAWGAYIFASGRSDIPNQINNLLAFPGILRGALDARVRDITMDHKYRAAKALANYVTDPNEQHLLPNPLDKGVAEVVAGVFMNSN